jgi:hypothetical protein
VNAPAAGGEHDNARGAYLREMLRRALAGPDTRKHEPPPPPPPLEDADGVVLPPRGKPGRRPRKTFKTLRLPAQPPPPPPPPPVEDEFGDL